MHVSSFNGIMMTNRSMVQNRIDRLFNSSTKSMRDPGNKVVNKIQQGRPRYARLINSALTIFSKSLHTFA